MKLVRSYIYIYISYVLIIYKGFDFFHLQNNFVVDINLLLKKKNLNVKVQMLRYMDKISINFNSLGVSSFFSGS